MFEERDKSDGGSDHSTPMAREIRTKAIVNEMQIWAMARKLGPSVGVHAPDDKHRLNIPTLHLQHLNVHSLYLKRQQLFRALIAFFDACRAVAGEGGCLAGK
jgi:hypothetical protein